MRNAECRTGLPALSQFCIPSVGVLPPLSHLNNCVMSTEPPRIAREKRTIRAMIGIYCRTHHATGGDLCDSCEELLGYAVRRLERCPFGADKTTCAHCPIHCYKPAMRERVKVVMRYSGPRMLLKHPLLALRHMLDSRNKGRTDG